LGAMIEDTRTSCSVQLFCRPGVNIAGGLSAGGAGQPAAVRSHPRGKVHAHDQRADLRPGGCGGDPPPPPLEMTSTELVWKWQASAVLQERRCGSTPRGWESHPLCLHEVMRAIDQTQIVVPSQNTGLRFWERSGARGQAHQPLNSFKFLAMMPRYPCPDTTSLHNRPQEASKGYGRRR